MHLFTRTYKHTVLVNVLNVEEARLCMFKIISFYSDLYLIDRLHLNISVMSQTCGHIDVATHEVTWNRLPGNLPATFAVISQSDNLAPYMGQFTPCLHENVSDRKCKPMFTDAHFVYTKTVKCT